MKPGAKVYYKCRWCGEEFYTAHVPDADADAMVMLGIMEAPKAWHGTIHDRVAHYSCPAAGPRRIGVGDLVGLEIDPSDGSTSPAPEAS